MRRQLIDYFGTRSSDGTCSLSPKKDLFVHETTTGWLFRYSILGWDQLPISQKEIFSSMRRQLIDHFGTRSSDGTSSLPPNKDSHLRDVNSSTATHSTDEEQNLLPPRRNYHPQKQRIIDYYSTWTISPFPTKELLVHETTSKSTTEVLEEILQDRRWQVHKKTNQPAVK